MSIRTTIRLNPTLLKRAKALAVKRNTTFTALVDEGLRYVLTMPKRNSSRKKTIKLPTVKGAVRKGVDLNSNSSLLDIMDRQS